MFSGRLSHFVSKRPVWLAEAAEPVIARSPTTQRIAGSRHSRSASFTSSVAGEPPEQSVSVTHNGEPRSLMHRYRAFRFADWVRRFGRYFSGC